MLLRYMQVFMFVLIYVVIGFALKPDANIYLLTGIPLTIFFQLVIRRQPLQTLWVRHYHPFQLAWWALIIALALMVYPARKIIDMVFKHNTNPVFYCYDVVTIAGAVAAAYSLQYFTKDTVRPFLLCLATAGAIAISFMVGGSAVRSILTHQALNFNVLKGVHSLLTYFPVSFMIEEVTFRGMLDGHLYRPGETKGMWPAIFVSALWGVWHFPIISLGTNKNALITGAIIIAFHTLVGVPLSIFWRRSGNLAVTSFTHAFIDAVRNALFAGV